MSNPKQSTYQTIAAVTESPSRRCSAMKDNRVDAPNHTVVLDGDSSSSGEEDGTSSSCTSSSTSSMSRDDSALSQPPHNQHDGVPNVVDFIAPPPPTHSRFFKPARQPIRKEPIPKEFEKKRPFLRHPSAHMSSTSVACSAANKNPYVQSSQLNDNANKIKNNNKVSFKNILSNAHTSSDRIKKNPYDLPPKNVVDVKMKDSSKIVVKHKNCHDYKWNIQASKEQNKTKIPSVLYKYSNETPRCPLVRVSDIASSSFSSVLWRPPSVGVMTNFFTFDCFNAIQSELLRPILHSEENIVVAAPTGAGKTCIFEIAMMKLFFHQLLQNGQSSRENKVVYMAPNKALCEERMTDWYRRFNELNTGIQVGLVTGDVYDTSQAFERVASSHLILTTPEKWDSVTRRWTDHLHILRCVKLLLIDEVHMLGDPTRGACLETVVCRMKTVSRQSSGNTNCCNKRLRIVAVSATLPNIADIATFLGAPNAFSFDNSYRPVPLTIHVRGFGWIGKNQYMFDRSLNQHVSGVISSFSEGKPVIVFCHTKKETEILAEMLHINDISHEARKVLRHTSKEVVDDRLRSCLLNNGSAYHHAGLEACDRQAVEHAFSMGVIGCLCATSTLAMGVNLPAHLVVIKGTSAWRGAGVGHEEIDRGTLLQMMGRAGRPQFDSHGVAVIMTDHASKRKYQQLSDGLEIIESQLLAQIVETLNTEVSQGVISCVSQAIRWIKSTFFFTRVQKNPKFYGLEDGKNIKEINDYLQEKCMSYLEKLRESGIISVSSTSRNTAVAALPPSHIMSKHMVPFQVMKRIIALPSTASTREILMVLAQCEGLQRPVRRSEKKMLNGVYKEVKLKYDGAQSKIRIQKPEQKAFVLLQAAIGQCFLDDYTLRQEMTFAADYAMRMLIAAEDYSVEESNHGSIALQCLMLRRSLATSLWGKDDGILNQLRGVGAKTTEKLGSASIKTFQDVVSKSHYTIENAAGRRPPFGRELREAVLRILQNSLSVSAAIEGADVDNGKREIVCTINKSTYNKSNKSEIDRKLVNYILIVYFDRPGGLLMYRRNIHGEGTHRVSCPKAFGKISIHLVANLVGLDEEVFLEGDSPISVESSSNKNKQASLLDSKVIKKQRSGTTKTAFSEVANASLNVVDSKRTLSKKQVVTPSPKTLSVDISNLEKDQRGTIHHGSQPVDVSGKLSPSTYNPPTKNSYLSNCKIGVTRTSSIEKSVDIKARNFPIQCTPRKDTATVKLVTSLQNKPKDKNFSNSFKCSNSWNQKRDQYKNLQKKASGNSPKASNPFSSFKFDPNKAEAQLERLSRNCTERGGIESVIPANINMSSYSSRVRSSEYRSGLKGTPFLRTPTRPGMANSLIRRRRGRPDHPRSTDILHVKANEQNMYQYEREKVRPAMCNYATTSVDGKFRYALPGTVPQGFSSHDLSSSHEKLERYPQHQEPYIHEVENFSHASYPSNFSGKVPNPLLYMDGPPPNMLNGWCGTEHNPNVVGAYEDFQQKYDVKTSLNSHYFQAEYDAFSQTFPTKYPTNNCHNINGQEVQCQPLLNDIHPSYQSKPPLNNRRDSSSHMDKLQPMINALNPSDQYQPPRNYDHKVYGVEKEYLKAVEYSQDNESTISQSENLIDNAFF